jgi:3-oxoacyl-[acyl-carrier-protein] synthase III
MTALNPHLPAVSILGVGHHLPTHIEDNETLCRQLDVTPQWIVEKTGIEQRTIAAPDDTAWGYALAAAKDALAMAGIEPAALGLIVVCTFSGDYIFPPVSAKLAQQLGASRAQVFDLQANCAGFVAGLTVASDRLRVDPEVGHALVVAVELCTRYIDRRDVNTAIYLSDAAGAAVLGPAPAGQGIQASAFHTDTSNFEAVRLRGGGAAYRSHHGNHDRAFDPAVDLMEMNGIATWKQAVTHLPSTIRRACSKSEVGLDKIDFMVFHQANLRLIEYLVRKLGHGMDKTFTNVARVGNSGSASLAVALSEAVQQGHLRPGQQVVLAGVGAGFTFGASVWRWTLAAPQ